MFPSCKKVQGSCARHLKRSDPQCLSVALLLMVQGGCQGSRYHAHFPRTRQEGKRKGHRVCQRFSLPVNEGRFREPPRSHGLLTLKGLMLVTVNILPASR